MINAHPVYDSKVLQVAHLLDRTWIMPIILDSAVGLKQNLSKLLMLER